MNLSRSRLLQRVVIFGTMAFMLEMASVGCGGSSHLQSIELTAASPTSEGFDVLGLGGTIQLVATGTYSDGKTRDITNGVAFQIAITSNSADQHGNALPTPPQGLEVSPTGLLTAEYPGVCTWINLNDSSATATVPAWAMTGSYTVTANDHGITSQPVYVAVASAIGIVDATNPAGACGPQPTP